MMNFDPETFRPYAEKHPKSNPNPIQYGTIGPRDKGEHVDSFIFRMGIIAAVRSRTMEGKVVGMMITAGHNHVDDNGVKIIDTNGQILDEPWEPLCDKLGNEQDQTLEAATQHLIKKLNIDSPGMVYIARDTRSTSEELTKTATDGVRSLDSAVRDYGLLTTAQLHYIVYTQNKGLPDATEAGYFTKHIGAFKELYAAIKGKQVKYLPKLNIDCGNGVGGLKIPKAKKLLGSHLIFNFHNYVLGPINYECGSFYVETEMVEPAFCTVTSNSRWASISGDAGRVIYFYKTDLGDMRILNGDKIASLFCVYIKELLLLSGLSDIVTLQVIVNAYSNRKTARFLRKYVGTNLECTAPGMKNLMKKVEKCDISIAYESNGQGSIFYDEKTYKRVQERADSDETGSAKILLKILDLMPQTIGDGICTLLLVEAILRAKDWTCQNWDMLYEPYPSRLLSVTVENRHFIKTNDLGSVVIEPENLKHDIDKLVADVMYPEETRAMVRPSGTQNIVRVYTESDTQENADSLAKHIVKLVESYSN